MKYSNLLEHLVTLLFLLINLSAYASITEYSIEGKFINYQNGDLEDLTITATKVTPSGQVSENIEISRKGSRS